MMKKRKNGWMRKGIIAMVSALTIAASAGTVLAYEPLQWSDHDVSIIMTADDSGEDHLKFDFSKSDSVFISETGEQTPVINSNSSKVLCKHNMVNGYLNNHKKNSSGGCTVKVYTCQRCTRCGYLANAKYHNTVTYAVCPHK